MRRCSIADTILGWPRLTWPALALRRAAPLMRDTEDALHTALGMMVNVAGKLKVAVLTEAPDQLFGFSNRRARPSPPPQAGAVAECVTPPDLNPTLTDSDRGPPVPAASPYRRRCWSTQAPEPPKSPPNPPRSRHDPLRGRALAAVVKTSWNADSCCAAFACGFRVLSSRGKR